jgi:hypothetical protein
LKWVTHAQFAGYYVAKAKGYYKDAGLDVTINPGGPDVAPPQVIAGGGADLDPINHNTCVSVPVTDSAKLSLTVPK